MRGEYYNMDKFFVLNKKNVIDDELEKTIGHIYSGEYSNGFISLYIDDTGDEDLDNQVWFYDEDDVIKLTNNYLKDKIIFMLVKFERYEDARDINYINSLYDDMQRISGECGLGFSDVHHDKFF